MIKIKNDCEKADKQNLKGEGIVNDNGTKKRISKGDIIHTRSGESHSITTVKDSFI